MAGTRPRSRYDRRLRDAITRDSDLAVMGEERLLGYLDALHDLQYWMDERRCDVDEALSLCIEAARARLMGETNVVG